VAPGRSVPRQDAPQQGFLEVELVGLEPTTSWVRYGVRSGVVGGVFGSGELNRLARSRPGRADSRGSPGITFDLGTRSPLVPIRLGRTRIPSCPSCDPASALAPCGEQGRHRCFPQRSSPGHTPARKRAAGAGRALAIASRRKRSSARAIPSLLLLVPSEREPGPSGDARSSRKGIAGMRVARP